MSRFKLQTGEFTVTWALWAIAMLIAEMVGAPWPLWLGLLMIFVLVETTAVIRRAPGDTLSENVWKWVGEHKIGRALQAGAFGLWLAWHFYLVVTRASGPRFVGPALLTLALAVWLVPHFVTRGETG